MKTLLAFSGGIDSIYILWKELHETTNDITAVFYTGDNIDADMKRKFNVLIVDDKRFGDIRWVQLQKMANAIGDKTRPFKIIREAIDPAFLNTNTNDTSLFNHGATLRTAMAVRAINAGHYDRLAVGTSLDNDGYWIYENGINTNETASSLITKYFIENAKRGELYMPFCDQEYTVAEAFKMLPDWLVSMNRSCSILLSNVNACGHCYKCLTHEYARKLLEEGKSLKEIHDVYMSESIMPDGSWRSQHVWICEKIPSAPSAPIKTMQMPKWGKSIKIEESP